MTNVPTETIDKDLTCLQCGYNLRTLDVSASCPECGWPVTSSVARQRPPLTKTQRFLVTAVLSASILTFVAVILTRFYLRPHGPMRYRPDWVLYWGLLERLFWITLAVVIASGLVTMLSPSLRRRWWFWLALILSLPCLIFVLVAV